jgi:hypothetical protein
MTMAMASEPRYPKIFVEIDSQNPLALVAAVREALRLAHVERSEISEFSDEAFASSSPREVAEVCREWVRVQSKLTN